METKIQFLKPEAKPRYISFKIKLIDFSKVHMLIRRHVLALIHYHLSVTRFFFLLFLTIYSCQKIYWCNETAFIWKNFQ